MRTPPLLLGATIAVSLFSLGLGASTARAQSQTAADSALKKITLQAQKMEVREALRAIFKQAGVSYTIAPEIQGNVDGDYQNLPMEDALRLILRQVNATWRTEGGVYQIIPREVTGLPTGQALLAKPDPVYGSPWIVSPTDESAAISSDATFLYVVRRGVVHKIEKESMREVGKLDLNERRIRITH